ncbi:MAG: hypothetical protein EBU93_06300, partial [Chlamydiae bacterium]|nr:hypothetical protein [Chlamydiota bacterium]
MMIFEILLSLFLLFILLDFNRIDSFLNSGFRKGFLKPATPWMKSEGLDHDPRWEGFKNRDPLKEGLKLWDEFFESIKSWQSMEPSNVAFEIGMLLNYGSANEMVEAFERNSWKLLVFPMIPDLIVERITNATGHFEDKLILSQEESKIIIKRPNEMGGTHERVDDLKCIVDFFLKFRFYRQLAQLIILMDVPNPLNWSYLKDSSAAGLIGVFSNLFCLKPEKIHDFIGPVGKDKLFLLAPLVASINRDPVVLRALIAKFFLSHNIKPIEILAQVCVGILLTDYSDDSINLYRLNEELIDHLQTVVEISGSLPKVLMSSQHLPVVLKNDRRLSTDYKNEVLALRIVLKACRVMNLIKLHPSNSQKIALSIYMDETDEHVEMLFKILKKIVNVTKSAFYAKLIDSY